MTTFDVVSSAIGGSCTQSSGPASSERLPIPLQVPLYAKNVAPSRESHLTRKMKCAPFLDHGKLTKRQKLDLEIGMAAVEASWTAVQLDPYWSIVWPMNHCILMALIVRDILHGMELHDAEVLPIGAQLIQIHDGGPVNVLTTGMPNAPVLNGYWNAHMVVTLGAVLLDPSCGQTQRHWNSAPDAAALLIEHDGGKVSLGKFGTANALVKHAYQYADFWYQMSYFALTRSVQERASGWNGLPDAQQERRKPLVAAALRLLCEQSPKLIQKIRKRRCPHPQNGHDQKIASGEGLGLNLR